MRRIRGTLEPRGRSVALYPCPFGLSPVLPVPWALQSSHSAAALRHGRLSRLGSTVRRIARSFSRVVQSRCGRVSGAFVTLKFGLASPWEAATGRLDTYSSH